MKKASRNLRKFLRPRYKALQAKQRNSEWRGGRFADYLRAISDQRRWDREMRRRTIETHYRDGTIRYDYANGTHRIVSPPREEE